MLQNLPQELLDLICELAGATSVLALRLTCRQLHKKSYHVFAASFFETVSTDLCPHSVSRLQQVAAHDQLRLYVSTVRFENIASCPNGRSHRPGIGFDWERNPTTRWLLPGQMTIATLLQAFRRIVNCRNIFVHDNISSWPDPLTPASTSLCLDDVIHISVLAAGHLPSLKSFSFRRDKMASAARYSLLPVGPASPLGQDWGRNLVNLQLQWGWNAEIDSIFLFSDIIERSRSLRRLSVQAIPGDFLRRIATAERVPPLEILDMASTRGMTADDWIALTSRFRDTLEHLSLDRARLQREGTETGGFGRICRHFTHELPRLKSLGLGDLTQSSDGDEASPLITLNQVLAWDEAPAEGTMELCMITAGRFTGKVTSIWYAGERADLQRVFMNVGEWCDDPLPLSQEQGDARLPVKEYYMLGKLRADVVPRMKKPELTV